MNSFIRSGISDFTRLLCFIILPVIGMSQVPYPPDSVYAEILGPDSALYVSWQTSDSAVIDPAAFNIYRLSNFDPEGNPGAGNQTFLLSQNLLFYFDPEWPELSPGWYAYGVEAVYNNGMVSEMAVSNIVGHNMFCSLNLTVSLETGEPAGMIHAELSGRDYPHEKYFSKDTAIVHFDSVLRGHYLVGAYHAGFDTGYFQNVLIYNDTSVNLILGQRKRPVYDLEVDSVSLIATWSLPALVAVYEDFESGPFPPAGWQVFSADEFEGWFRTLDGSSSGFAIPPGDGFYACSSDNMWAMAGTALSEHNGCCDYLVIPPLDLSESEDYELEFDSFYDGSYGQLAFVEYSYDRGETWEVLWQINPSTKWDNLSTDLTPFCGEDKEMPIWFAFHADDNGMWTSGWAVDNIKIHVPGSMVDFTDFNVFLDDSLVTNTTNTTWNYAPLNYGQHYTAFVSVNYPYGTSKSDYYSFTSRYLPPPRDFTAQENEDDVVLQWYPPDDSLNRSGHENEAIPGNLLGYNLYKNDSLLTCLAHASANELQLYVDSDNYPGFYYYEISGIYDLEEYGFPGDTGESMRIGPSDVTIDYCTGLEFHEDWSSGTFYTNQWQTSPDEWRISEGIGNPAPCAEFMPDTILSNYSSALMSYPLCGNALSEGQIWLDFDLNLISNNNTGDEKLKVQLWNWEINSWTTAMEYSNIAGNIPWTHQHFYINDYAMSNIFRVRFAAEGVNSSDIGKWRLDNIDIYRVCAGPDSLWLEVSPDESSISLFWNSILKPGDQRDLMGYNIYRKLGLAGEYELIDFIAEEPCIYTDLINELYCFKVTAVWSGEYDQCESDYSNEACALITVGFDDPEVIKTEINLHPNPAKNLVMINSSEIIKTITVYDISGKIIIDISSDDRNICLNTTAIPDGLHLVKIETETNISFHKLVIDH